MSVRFSQIVTLVVPLAAACGGRSNIGDSGVTSGVGGALHDTSSSAGASPWSGATGKGGGVSSGGILGAPSGGASATGGSSSASGGTKSTGSTVVGKGGASATGGASNARGGTGATGGTSTGKGGTGTSAGTLQGKGGTNTTGGSPPGKGGTSSAQGGMVALGGSLVANGGTTATGGVSSTTESSGGTASSATSSPCEGDRVLCGTGATAKCVDTSTDPHHCGQCDSACAVGVTCSSGACEPPRCAPTFELGSKPVIETGGSAIGLAVGDLNGDGYLDMASANGAANTVSVLLGNDKGDFAGRTEYPTGNNPKAIATRDLNRDGKLDLVTADYDSNSVSVLLNKGDGTFSEAVASPVELGPSAIVIEDFDDDGDDDIAIANYDAGVVSVLLGTGEGTFAAKVGYATAGSPQGIVAGDLNGDGKVDLATNNGAVEGLSVLLGAGDGTFTRAPDPATNSIPSSITGLALGDLDRDGILDLIVSRPNGRYSSGVFGVLYGVGDGSFLPIADLASWGLEIVAVADLNGDGTLEVVGSHGPAMSVIFLGDSGTQATDVEYRVPAPPEQVVFGDFNGDNWLDIATANRWGIYVLLSTGNGRFDYPESQPAGGSLRQVVLRDLNGDGRLDLAGTASDADAVRVMLGLGNGTFGPSKEYPTGYGQGLLDVGDLNGDGHPDLVTTNEYDSGVSVLWNVGDASFPTRTDLALANAPNFLALGDLDSNGKSDILVASGNYYDAYAITVLTNQGNGTFVTTVYYEAEPWGTLGLVDLNHDGSPDLVQSSGEPNGLIVRPGLGDGSFGTALRSQTNQASISAYDAAFGDLNGDGHLDLVAPDFGSTHLAVMFGVGDGTFLPAAQHVVTGNFGSGEVALGDLNGDGKLDLVWLDLVGWVGNEITVMLGVGDGTFTCSTAAIAGVPNQEPLVLGDLNADGRTDLVLPDSESNGVRVLLSQPL